MTKTTPEQKLLRFDGKAETDCQQRVERILGTDKRITTAARLFDEQAFREATALVQAAISRTET